MKPVAALLALLALPLALSACATGRVIANPPPVASDTSLLASSWPADGATVRGPVERIELNFKRPAALFELTVVGSDGSAMPTMISPAGEVPHYSVPLSGLDPGPYTAAWRARSGGSEHRGKISFTVR